MKIFLINWMNLYTLVIGKNIRFRLENYYKKRLKRVKIAWITRKGLFFVQNWSPLLISVLV